MSRRIGRWVWAVIVALAAGGPALAEPIDWTDDWDRTYQQNQQRWEPLRADDAPAYHQRMVAMLRGLLVRHPEADDHRVEAYKELAQGYAALDMPWWRDHWRGKLARLWPEQREAARAALEQLLNSPWDSAFGDQAGREAAHQVLALVKHGELEPGDALASMARRRLVRWNIEAGRLHAAMSLLDQIQEVEEEGRVDTNWQRDQRVQIFLRAGRPDQAAALLRSQGTGLLPDQAAADRLMERIEAFDGSNADEGLNFPTDAKVEHLMLFARSGSEAQALQEALHAAAESSALVVWDDRRRRAGWFAMAALPDAGSATAAMASEVEAGSLGDVMRAYRQAPGAVAVHRTMLAEAERLLRADQVGMARRMLQDVLAWTGDPGVQASARRGLALADLQHEASVTEVAALNTTPRLISLPAQTPWPLRSLFTSSAAIVAAFPPAVAELVTHEQWVFAAAPGYVAGYEVGHSQPRWVRRSPLVYSDHWDGVDQRFNGRGGRASEGERIVVPGRFRPVSHGNLIVVRGEPGRELGRARSLMALERATGRLVWSTSGRETWTNLRPVGEPAVAEGRLYTLARVDGWFSELSVACLDASSGDLLWHRPLVTGPAELVRGSDGRQWLDVIEYGSGVEIAGGAVYCQTSMGVAARLDARDGLVEWVRTYPRPAGEFSWDALLPRRGGRPVVIGDRVVMTPRDHAGVLALDAATGELAWERPVLASRWIVAASRESLVLAGASEVLCINPLDGRVRWQAVLQQAVRTAAAGHGRVVVGMARGFVVLDAESGAIIEQHNAPDAVTFDSMVLASAGVVATTSDVAGLLQDGHAPGTESLEADLDAGLWRLARPRARILLHEPGQRLTLVQSGAVLEAIDPVDGHVRWRRLLPWSASRAVRSADVLLVLHPQQLLGLSVDSGEQRWTLDLPFLNPILSADGSEALVRDHRLREWDKTPMLMVDASSGDVLWGHDYEGRPQRRFQPTAALWQAQQIHLLANPEQNRGTHMLSIRRSDGVPLSNRRYLPSQQMMYLGSEAIMGEAWYAAGLDGHLHGFRWTGEQFDRTGRVELPEQGMQRHGRSPTSTVSGDAILVVQPSSGIWHHNWLIDRRTMRLSQYWRAPHTAVASGGSAFRFHSRKGGESARIEQIDPTGQQRVDLKFDTGPSPSGLHGVDVYDGGIATVTAVSLAHGEGVRVDRWREDGGWIGGRTIPLSPQATTVALQGGTAVLVDDTHVYGGSLDAMLRNHFDAIRMPAAGDAADADPDSWVVLRATHDDEHLLLRFMVHADHAAPLRGEAGQTGGTALELAINDHRWLLGFDNRGEMVCRTLEGTKDQPLPVRAIFKHDSVTGRLTVEVALPLAALGLREGSRMGVSAALWDDVTASSTLPVRRLLVGGGIQGTRMQPGGHDTIILNRQPNQGTD